MALNFQEVFSIVYIVSSVTNIEVFAVDRTIDSSVSRSYYQSESVVTSENASSKENTTSASRGNPYGNEIGYDTIRCLLKEMLSPNRYNPQIRPVYNQHQQLTVCMRLSILELVSIDDIQQRMITDTYIVLEWQDQLITWNSSEMGNIPYITPGINDVWKPDITVYNSLERREALGFSSNSQPKVFDNSRVIWGFDDLLTTSCNLNMEKYPFDEQTCYIEFASTTYRMQDLNFCLVEAEVDLSLISKNYGWEIFETQTEIGYLEYMPDVNLPKVKFTIKVRRKPTFIMINDILPTVALSFLNCFVFLVPVDSGEKISFGISVLLALAMFVSNTGARLPSASDGTPALTKYLGLLFMNSIAAVLLTLVNVKLHKRATKLSSKEEVYPKSSPPRGNQVVAHVDGGGQSNIENNAGKEPRCEGVSCRNGNKGTVLMETILQHTDMLGFLVIMGIWCFTSVWYFTFVIY